MADHTNEEDQETSGERAFTLMLIALLAEIGFLMLVLFLRFGAQLVVQLDSALGPSLPQIHAPHPPEVRGDGSPYGNFGKAEL